MDYTQEMWCAGEKEFASSGSNMKVNQVTLIKMTSLGWEDDIMAKLEHLDNWWVIAGLYNLTTGL